MGPPAEVQALALAQASHVDFLANTVIQFEEHTATAIDQAITVLCNHKINVVIAVEKAELSVGFIRCDNVLNVESTKTVDDGDEEIGCDFD